MDVTRVCNRLLHARTAVIPLALPLEACTLEIQIEEQRSSCCLQGCVRVDLEASRDGRRWSTLSHTVWILPNNLEPPLRAFPVPPRSPMERRRIRVRLASFEPMPVRVQVFVSPLLEEETETTAYPN